MKKQSTPFAWIGILALSCALVPSPAKAEMCTIDVVPAATLLLPYFEVDVGDANDNDVPDCAEAMGVDTVFSINNA